MFATASFLQKAGINRSDKQLINKYQYLALVFSLLALIVSMMEILAFPLMGILLSGLISGLSVALFLAFYLWRRCSKVKMVVVQLPL